MEHIMSQLRVILGALQIFFFIIGGMLGLFLDSWVITMSLWLASLVFPCISFFIYLQETQDRIAMLEKQQNKG